MKIWVFIRSFFCVGVYKLSPDCVIKVVQPLKFNPYSPMMYICKEFSEYFHGGGGGLLYEELTGRKLLWGNQKCFVSVCIR